MPVIINEVPNRQNPPPQGMRTCGNFSRPLEDFYTSLSNTKESSRDPDTTTSLSVEDESIDGANENRPNTAVPHQMVCMVYIPGISTYFLLKQTITFIFVFVVL